MNKRDILARINELLLEEKGRKVAMDGNLRDAQLDFMGTTFFLIGLDNEFHMLDKADPERDFLHIRIKGIQINELVTKCLLSTAESTI